MLWHREQTLLDQIQAIAEKARHEPNARVRRLVEWIRKNLCPDLPPVGKQRAAVHLRFVGSRTNAKKDRSSGNCRFTVVTNKEKWKSRLSINWLR
jgi:hypothetical protein